MAIIKRKKSSFISFLKCLSNFPFLITIQNVEIVIHIYCCVASSNATRERSISLLKIIQQYYLSWMKKCHHSSSLFNINMDDDLLQKNIGVTS